LPPDLSAFTAVPNLTCALAEFDSHGVRLHFELNGPNDGPAIVLVHGFCSDYALNWVGSRWQEALVNDGRLVIGLDCRGHGHSEKPHDPEAYDRATMAADVVRLLDHLGIDRADYLGYSMGGRIGLQLLVDCSARVRRAVLGGIGRWAGSERPRHAELTARRMRGDASVDDPMATMFYEFAASRPINDLEALACCILGAQRQLGEDELLAVPSPVLICAGDRDPLAQGADQLARLLGDGHFFEIEGRNHMNAVPARTFKEAALNFLE
jgi:pimeloyl-ACP methyl ester carboxylesterase